MTKQARTVRVLDGIIAVLIVAVLISWRGNERGSEEGAASAAMSPEFFGVAD